GFDAFDTVWLSDGLDHPERSALTSVFNDNGTLTVFEAERFVLGLSSARLDAGALLVKALRSEGEGRQDITIEAVGLDPSGITRVLAEQVATFEPGITELDVAIELPTELRNRVTRLQIAGLASAGAVVLSDSSLKRKRVGLYTPVAEAEATTLQSPLHYLENALVETADPFESDLATMLDVGPDVIIMADVATLSAVEEERLVQWVSDGGILVRFAGPRLASAGSQITDADPLLPVLLRAGGREIGGTMSWGDPKTLQDFPEGSPFFGLEIPADVQVSSQVLAQPDPELAEKTYASLLDGTPLVTGSPLGNGQVILFHVTANANWSNLPISVLFVQMLERLSILSAASLADAETLEGRLWTPEQVLDGFGIEGDGGLFAAVDGARFVSEVPGPDLRPGLYSEG
ncbi:MAG: LytTR family transcriptional regulator, partial [Pseudomonadota bacterium]